MLKIKTEKTALRQGNEEGNVQKYGNRVVDHIQTFLNLSY